MKELKKKYGVNVMEKAMKIQEVLGGVNEDYFEITEKYFNVSVNDLVEMIMNDPAVMNKFSSYV